MMIYGRLVKRTRSANETNMIETHCCVILNVRHMSYHVIIYYVAVRCGTVRYGTVQYGTVRYSARW